MSRVTPSVHHGPTARRSGSRKENPMKTAFTIARVAGMALLILVSAGCADLPRESAARANTPQDVRLALLDRARWSMSAHNMQPWVVALDKDDPLGLRVFLANDRLLPATDPYSRQIVMSVGAFLAVIEDGAEAWGYSARVSLFPEGEQAAQDGGQDFRLPVAGIVLSAAPPSGAAYLDALSSATVKDNLGPAALLPEERSALLALNTFPGVHVDLLHEADDLAGLKPILKEAFRLEMSHGPTLSESYDLMRRNRRQILRSPWGLSYGSNFPRGALGWIELFETLFPMRPDRWGMTGADNFDKEIDNGETFLIIRTAQNTRGAQIESGMVFQRVWLEAIHQGKAVLPASQPLQEYEAMSGLYQAVHGSFAEPGETIQMIALLGTPSGDYRRGFRLPVERLLRQE
jgi:hypothetical protein